MSHHLPFDTKTIVLNPTSAKQKKQLDTLVEKSISQKTHAAKVMEQIENDECVQQKPSLQLRKIVQEARKAKQWTQKQLAQQLNVKPSVIHEIESGKTLPDGPLKHKLNRVLGIKLPKQ